MLILAVDTSGKDGSIALARGDASAVEPLETVPLAGGTYSAQLVPQIALVLQRNGLRSQDLDGFAVVSGPGSFTGLRVGLATVKGLAEVVRRPIAAVSLLEVIASLSPVSGRIIAAADALRGEVYVGEYDVEAGEAKLVRESLLTRDEFSALSEQGGTVVTPDASIAELAGASAISIQRSHADMVARIGLRKLLRGEVTAPEELEANYIRRSDAEVFSLPKLRA
jgi:tRNA threonylcarbamoyladenosine biosynthesis protein TsaB